MNTENLKIAKTIALQLGELGLYRKAKIKNLVTIHAGLAFEVKGNKNFKKVAITINENDLYDVILINWKRNSVASYTNELVKDVYAEDLMPAMGF